MENFITQDAGIYKIENQHSEKKTVYVGSTCNFRNRQYQHFSDLRLGKHSNNHLQNSYNKHGSKGFSFEILEIVSDEGLLEEREQYWLDYYKSFCLVYNTGRCVKNPFRGMKRPQETIDKMKSAQAGKKPSREVYMAGVKAAAEKLRGKPRSQETKDKISAARIGHIVTQETKDAIGKANKNKKRTSEQIQRMRDAGLKRWTKIKNDHDDNPIT